MEDTLLAHHSSKEDISSDWHSSDWSPSWSSENEDPQEEEEEDEDEDEESISLNWRHQPGLKSPAQWLEWQLFTERDL
jgi:hypothetical protein